MSSEIPYRTHRDPVPGDISPYIRDVSLRPVTHGGPSDIYIGKYCAPGSESSLKVALKVHRIANHVGEKILRRLDREIALWKSVDHPCIQPLLGLYSGMTSLPAMVSPWCEMGDINAYLALPANRESGRRDALTLDLLLDVLYGLEYLHGRNIVHADIKGANVLVSDDGVARLCDFGFSTVLAENATSISHHTSMKGTYRWMAPELFAEDGARHTRNSDIWACGCLLIEVQSGHVPYHTRRSDQAVILALSRHELPERPIPFSDALWRLVLSCCATNPSYRPSVNDILQRMLSLRTGAGPLRRKDEDEAVLRGVLRRAVSAERLESTGTIEDNPYAAAQRILKRISENNTASTTSESDAAALKELSCTDPGRRCLRDSPDADKTLIEMLQVCVSQLQPGSKPSTVLVDTAHALVLAFHDRDIENIDDWKTYLPAEVRPFAAALAWTEPSIAGRFMEMFSSASIGQSFKAHTDAVKCVTYLCTGDRIVTASADETLLIWDVGTQRPAFAPMEGHTDWVRCVAVSPDGMCIVSGSGDKTIRIWSADTGEPIGDPIVGHTRGVNSVSFSPDGKRLVSGSDDRTILVWDLTTGSAVVGPLQGHTGVVAAVAFSPDGTCIASGARDATVRLWNAQTGECISETLKGHTQSVRCVAFSPDGTHIVYGSSDDTLRVWDAASGQTVLGPLRGHARTLTSVEFSPDGSRIVSGSADGTVRLWDRNSGKCLDVLRGHTDWVRSVTFSPDGRRIASASEDRTVRIWDATQEWKRWDVDDA